MVSKLKLLPEDISERLKGLPERAAQVEGLSALWLFGSFARGEATSISDVDLAYLPNQALELQALERFEDRLYRMISSTLGTDEISLVNVYLAPAFLSWRVLAEGVLLFCRDQGAVSCLAEGVYRKAPDVRWLRASGNAQFLEVFKMSDRIVDRERVTEFLRLISQDLLVLRGKAQVPIETYLNSQDLQSIVERRLQTAIESAINIGNHIIARLGLRAPQDYADVFRILQEAGVLPAEIAQQMYGYGAASKLACTRVLGNRPQARLYEVVSADEGARGLHRAYSAVVEGIIGEEMIRQGWFKSCDHAPHPRANPDS